MHNRSPTSSRSHFLVICVHTIRNPETAIFAITSLQFCDFSPRPDARHVQLLLLAHHRNFCIQFHIAALLCDQHNTATRARRRHLLQFPSWHPSAIKIATAGQGQMTKKAVEKRGGMSQCLTIVGSGPHQRQRRTLPTVAFARKKPFLGPRRVFFFPISLMKGRFIRLVRRVLVSRFRLVRRRLIPSVTAGHPRGQDSSSNRFHWAITTQLPTLSEVA